MATTTLRETADQFTAMLKDANRAVEVADQAAALAAEKMGDAGQRIVAAAVFAVKFRQQDRRSRVSVQSHVDDLLGLGGRIDLAALEQAFAERPQLFGDTLGRGMVRAEHEVEDGHWRNGTHQNEATLLRALAGWDNDTADQIARELARANANAFHLTACAFLRVHRRRPELFGPKTRAEDAAEMQSAQQIVDKALAALRTRPPLLVALAAEYGVRLRADADGAQDVLDAAVAAARR